MQTRPEVLKDLVERFWEDGWQTVSSRLSSVALQLLTAIHRQNIHCIGDRANKAVLDIFESQLGLKDGEGHRKYDVHRIRPRIEHAQIFDKPDLGERIGRLGGGSCLLQAGVVSDCASSHRQRPAYTCVGN